MKYLLISILAGLFVICPTFAQKNNYEQNKRHEKKQWKILKNISMNERKRLRKLNSTDPEAFRKEIAKIVQRNRKQRQEKHQLDQQIKKLANEYKATKDIKTKKEIMNKLQKIIRNIFLKKMQKNKQGLESLEKHVKNLRQQYEFRQKNADKIIQRRLKTLTNDAKFDW